MPEQLQTCAYRVVRYVPSLVRNEPVNIGVVLFEPGGRLEARLLESDGDFARLRRLHPHVDTALLRGLGAELATRLVDFERDPAGHLEKLDSSLSNVVQFGPQKGVMTENFDAELARLFETLAAPPQPARIQAEQRVDTSSAIRRQANSIFASAGILRKMRPARAAEWTYRGDPMRLDFTFGNNGSRGFAQALALNRDPAQAKALAFTSERIRARIANATFTAITDAEPRRDVERHAFVQDVLQEQQIEIVPLSQLYIWARDLSATIREN